MGLPFILSFSFIVVWLLFGFNLHIELDLGAIITVISILMALSILWIGLLSASKSKLVELLQEKTCRKTLNNLEINLQRKSLIQVIRLMLVQVFTLILLLLFNLFTNGNYDGLAGIIVVGFILFLLLDNLLSVMMLVTELYYVIAKLSKTKENSE